MTPEWVKKKADALVLGWRMEFHDAPDPTEHAITLALAVATHETSAGDAWRGPDGIVGTQDDERNWGATTLRALNAAERAVLSKAGIVPTVGSGHTQRALDAMAAIRAAGLPLPGGVIHCDSSPKIGPYFVWFKTNSTHAEGAQYFLHLLCGAGGKKRAYSVLLDPKGNEQQLAEAMYNSGYYTGFHNPKEPGGAQKNIDDYANSLRALTPSIRAGLKGYVYPAADAKEEPVVDPKPAARPVASEQPTSSVVETSLSLVPPEPAQVDPAPSVSVSEVTIIGAYQGPWWKKLLTIVFNLLFGFLRPKK